MNIKKDFLQLKVLWQQTGALHEFHLAQLKYWVLCVLPNTEKGEVCIDQEAWVIDFKITPKFLASFFAPKDAQARCELLEKWCHELLDGRVLVRVFWGKELIYTGMRTVTPEIPQETKVSDKEPAPWVPNPKVKY